MVVRFATLRPQKETNTTDILRALKKAGANVGEELLERAFRVFERQSEVDSHDGPTSHGFSADASVSDAST